MKAYVQELSRNYEKINSENEENLLESFMRLFVALDIKV